MLRPFDIIPHVVMTPNHKIISLLLLGIIVSIRYVGHLKYDLLQKGRDPQVENGWYESL